MTEIITPERLNAIDELIAKEIFDGYIKNYTIDIAAAWEIRQKFLDSGSGGLCIEKYCEEYPECCEIYDGQTWHVRTKLVPLSICLCVLWNSGIIKIEDYSDICEYHKYESYPAEIQRRKLDKIKELAKELEEDLKNKGLKAFPSKSYQSLIRAIRGA